jgi:hypothetical protein
VRVDKYRFDESGLVAEHLTLFSDSHIAQPELAYVGAEGDLWIANLDGSGATKITSSGDIAHPAWSHDGKILAYVRRRGDAEEIWTWRPGVGARLILQAVAYGSESPPRYALIRNLAWDASGTRIFYNEHRSAPNLSRIRTHSVYDPDLTAAHDSTLLDSSDLEQDNAEIAGFDITSDASTLVLEICSSPAGSSSGCGVYTRQIGDPARASTPVVPIKLGAFAGLPSLSPDGQLIAYYVYPRIEVVRRSTLELLVSQEAFPTTLNEDTFWPRIAWSPDSSSIYYETKVDGSSTIAFRNLTDQTLHALGDGRFPAIIH